jgi:hypothetical protein
MQQLLMQQLLMQQLLMQQVQQETKLLWAIRLLRRMAALLMLPLQEEQRQLAGQWLVRVRDQVAALQGQEGQHLATVTERQLAGQWLVRVRDQVAALQGQEGQHLVNRGSILPTTDKRLSVCIHSHNFFALCVYDYKVSTSSSPLSVAPILGDMRNFSEFLHYELGA